MGELNQIQLATSTLIPLSQDGDASKFDNAGATKREEGIIQPIPDANANSSPGACKVIIPCVESGSKGKGAAGVGIGAITGFGVGSFFVPPIGSVVGTIVGAIVLGGFGYLRGGKSCP